MERPLLRALRVPCVLLIDEIDRADSEFEAFLLEFLCDFQITIPELGTVARRTPPVVVMTSNRTRELHDALKRRCLYHWIEFPDAARERAIIDAKVPGLADDAAASLVDGRDRRAAAAADQAAGHRRDDRVGAGREAAQPTRGRGGRWRCGGRSACWSRRPRTPRPCWRTPKRSGFDASHSDGTSSTTAADLDASRPARAADRLPDARCADNPPPDIMRLYWLARVTLVTRLEDIPRFDALFATHFTGAPTRSAEPSEEGETEAPQPATTGELQPVGLARGHRQGRQRPRAAQPAQLRRHAPTDLAELRKALARAPPAHPLAGGRSAAPPRPPRPAPHAARTPPAPARSRTLARRGRPHRTAAAAAPDRRLRLAARAHARLPALRLGRAGRDVHVRHAPDADHQGAAAPRRRRRAGQRQPTPSTTPTAAPASAPRCRSSSTRRATPTARAAR